MYVIRPIAARLVKDLCPLATQSHFLIFNACNAQEAQEIFGDVNGLLQHMRRDAGLRLKPLDLMMTTTTMGWMKKPLRWLADSMRCTLSTSPLEMHGTLKRACQVVN